MGMKYGSWQSPIHPPPPPTPPPPPCLIPSPLPSALYVSLVTDFRAVKAASAGVSVAGIDVSKSGIKNSSPRLTRSPYRPQYAPPARRPYRPLPPRATFKIRYLPPAPLPPVPSSLHPPPSPRCRAAPTKAP